MITRRNILLGLIAAPAIIRPGVLMKIAPRLVVDRSISRSFIWTASMGLHHTLTFEQYNTNLTAAGLKIGDKVTLIHDGVSWRGVVA